MRTYTRKACLALFAVQAVSTFATSSFAKERESKSLVSGPHASLFAGTPKMLDANARSFRGEAKARAVVKALAPTSTMAFELVRTQHERFGDGDEIVSFGQVYRGLPVVGYGATVRMDKDGDVVFSSIDLATRDLPVSTKPALTKSEALDRVSRKYGIALAPTDAYLVVASTFEGAKLVYVVLPSLPLAGGAMPRFMVDATDGVILEARDVRTFSSAQVYPANPEKTKDTQLLPFAIEPVGGKLENPFVRTYNCIDRKEAKDVSFSGFKLKVHTCNLEQLAKPNADGNYVYASKDFPDPGAVEDEYSEVSMYYHATRAYDFFRRLQGSVDAQVTADKPLRTIANLRIDSAVQGGAGGIANAGDVNKPLAPFQNAFFSPKGGGLGDIFAQIYGFADGSMWFGQGPARDYSYDGDVIVHEFGHAVVDNSIKLESWTIDSGGASAAPGSMNEALADYFSSALMGDPDVGEYASKDFSPNATVIRTLDNKDTCENAILGEVHFDSTLFSGALWEARTKLPAGDREKLDAAIYKSLRTNAGRGRVSYTELAQLFLATVGTDFPAAKPILEAAFTGRKVLPGCVRVRTFEGKALDAPTGPSSPGAYAAPSKAAVGQRDTAPGIITFKAAVPAGSTTGTFSFKVAASGGGGGGLFGGGGKPFAPVLFVKFGSAITWTTKGKLASDADLTIPLEEKATSGEFEIPADTKEVYVQLGNAGDQDGNYGGITFAFAGAPVAPVPPVNPGNGNPAPTSQETVSSGCSVPASSGSSIPAGAAGLVAMVAAAFVARRRRP